MSEPTTSTPLPFVCSPHPPSPPPPSPLCQRLPLPVPPVCLKGRRVATRSRQCLLPTHPLSPPAIEEALSGTKPMTDAHLDLLWWESPNMPWFVRRAETEEDASNKLLTGDAGRRDMVQGWKVSYVPPGRTLEKVVGLLESGLYHDSDKRYISRPYVSGPSGSGKSRIGWEAYLELKRKFEKPNGSLPALNNVVYFSVTIGRPRTQYAGPHLGVTSTRDVISEILFSCAKGPDGHPLPSQVKAHKLTLAEVARNLSGWKKGGQRTALVLHIDEFQRNPKAVLDLQDAIEKANRDLLGNVLILPICTGLYSKDFRELKDLDNSDNSHAVYLGYLSTPDGAADHEAAWQVVRNACTAVRGVDLLPKTLEEVEVVSPVLRYLVEDLGGWPMAAVQLGGQLAAQTALKKATAPGDVKWGRVQLGACEAGMDRVIDRRYSAPVTSFKGNLDDAGVFKLVTLILSPFPVRPAGEGWEGAEQLLL